MFNKIAHHFWLTDPLDLWTTYHWAIFFFFFLHPLFLSPVSLSLSPLPISLMLAHATAPSSHWASSTTLVSAPPSFLRRASSVAAPLHGGRHAPPLLLNAGARELRSSSCVGWPHPPLPVTAHHPQAALLRLMEPWGARGSWGNLVFSSPPTSSSSPHKHGTPSPELIPHFDGAKLFPECVPGVVPEVLSNVPSINLQLSWA